VVEKDSGSKLKNGLGTLNRTRSDSSGISLGLAELGLPKDELIAMMPTFIVTLIVAVAD